MPKEVTNPQALIDNGRRRVGCNTITLDHLPKEVHEQCAVDENGLVGG